MPTVIEKAGQVRDHIGRAAASMFWGEDVNQYELQDLLRGKIPSMDAETLNCFRRSGNFSGTDGYFSYDFTPEFSPGEGEVGEALRFLVEQRSFPRQEVRDVETREFLIKPNGEVLRVTYDAIPVGSDEQRMPQVLDVAHCIKACGDNYRPNDHRIFPQDKVPYVREVLADFLAHEGKDNYWHGPEAVVSLLKGEHIGSEHRPLGAYSISSELIYRTLEDDAPKTGVLRVKSEKGLPFGEPECGGLALVFSRNRQDTTRFGITPEGELLNIVRNSESLEANSIRLERELSLLKRAEQ
jgi:hypothetical protein